ncbi:exonuclease III [Leptolyngbya sp. PCC 7375]|nr:exonuclease III [Leptolyngbya sp. PCC 7375]
MPRILFWNVNNKDLTGFVCSIAASTNADIIVLNENNVPVPKTLQSIQKEVSSDFYHPDTSSEERFHCFCKNPEFDLSEIHAGFRTSVRQFKIGQHNALLALVHGVDIRNYDPEARQSFAQELAGEMRFVKKQQNTKKLILLGDFNMNPFDRGMNLAAGLNAMMTKSCVRRGYRKHLDKNYDLYYNPMWSLFGDNTDGPAGTVYDTSNQGPYGWSMLDQIVINHSIVELFCDVQILTDAGAESLMDAKGHPDINKASDHFPILVNFCGEQDE